MKIAVVDVAAEKGGGGFSVLEDFINFIQHDAFCLQHTWIVYTSVDLGIQTSKIENIVVSKVKKSWIHRLIWEQLQAKKEFETHDIELVISLQNTACRKGKYHQITYFHNMLLLDKTSKFSFFKKSERRFAINKLFLTGYTIRTLKNTDRVIVQTETSRKLLMQKENGLSITVINPNVTVEEKCINSIEYPIKGLLYPANPNTYKRFEEIVLCVKRNRQWFIDKDFHILLTITGDENDYAKQIKETIVGVENIIHLIGHQDRKCIFDLFKEYGLLFTSSLESFSLPFIEASLIGSPIVAAEFSYTEECIRFAQHAFTYPPGDIEKLMDCIRQASNIRNDVDLKETGYYNTWIDMDSVIKEVAFHDIPYYEGK